jgi:phosphatidylserine/phosphatidylglycerophosphate/cardiolipin synthase-like enzyme
MRVCAQFAVLDGGVLVNGSFNWTRGAATANCENIMIVNHRPLARAAAVPAPRLALTPCGAQVEQYSAEFERLWSKFA